jgi:hypothetical protein
MTNINHKACEAMAKKLEDGWRIDGNICHAAAALIRTLRAELDKAEEISMGYAMDAGRWKIDCTALTAQRDKMRAALLPFAAFFDAQPKDHASLVWGFMGEGAGETITADDFRRARATLQGE